MDVNEDFKRWREAPNRGKSWIEWGQKKAKSLRSSGNSICALAYLITILESYPSNRSLVNQKLWCLYDLQIKDPPGTESYKDISIHAEQLLSECVGNQKYTPYVNICLRMAEMALQSLGLESATECRRWLLKIDKTKLTDEFIKYTTLRGEEFYWSQKRRYLELNIDLLVRESEYRKALWFAIKLIETCRSSETQRDHSLLHVWRLARHVFYEDDHGIIKDNSDPDEDRRRFLLIMHKRGFASNLVRDHYESALAKKYMKYQGWDKSTNLAVWEPDLVKMQYTVIKEIYNQSVSRKRLPIKKFSISATDLSSFAFCPASYSIQKTFEAAVSEIGNIGEQLHDKRILLSKRVEQTRTKMFNISSGKKPATCIDLGVSESIWKHISPLIEEISVSKMVFHGHGRGEKVFFVDSSGKFVGSPDYIFQKRNGTRFVVEEKFSLQKPNSRWISEPFSNHVAQVAAYMGLIDKIEAQYGYLLYWTFSFGDNERPYIRSAQAFKIFPSTDLVSWVRGISADINSLYKSEKLRFDQARLNSWKCVNCVVSDLCNHKTGIFDCLTFPYATTIPMVKP